MKRKKNLKASPKYSFSGGLVTMASKTKLHPSQLIKAKNMNILVDGEIEVRGGCEKASTVPFGTIIDRFFHFITPNYDKIIAYGGVNMKRLDVGTPDVWTSLSNAMPDTDDYRSMLIAKGMLYIGAIDATGVRKYYPDKDEVWPAGITKPTTKLTATEGAAGVLTGEYYYYYTYYNSITGEESNPNPISDKITVASKQIVLSGFIASTDTQVLKMNIYRNTSGVSQYFYVGQKDNDTANYTDNCSDNDVGDEISFRNGIPPTSAIIHYHLNHMLYVDWEHPTRLYWSEPFMPGSVHTNSYWDIESKNGGRIIALASSYDNVIVIKSNGVVCLHFNAESPKDSVYTLLTVSYGGVAPMSTANIGEDVIFLSPEGLKLITEAGSRISDIVIPIEGDFGVKPLMPITNIFRECFSSMLSRAIGAYYESKNQYHISVPYHTENNNDMTIVWHRDSNVFTIHEDFNVKAGALYNKYDHLLIYRSHNDQYIYCHDKGNTDDTSPIEFEVQTGWYDINGIPDKKRIRLVYPTIYGADGTILNYEILKDFETVAVPRVITHRGASYWGSAHWGQNYWGASGEVIYRHRTRIRGRIFSTRFYGSVNAPIGISGYQFFYQPKAL